jgi:hypothetical protein
VTATNVAPTPTSAAPLRNLRRSLSSRNDMTADPPNSLLDRSTLFS